MTDAEIERLQKEVDRLSQCVLYHDGQIADAKAEAIKEFWEKLREKAYVFDEVEIVDVKDGDNLVKEMVGE